jgi:hypothetical protein
MNRRLNSGNRTAAWGGLNMDCSQCGSLVQEGQEICPACGGQVGKRSFWRRLWQWFSSGNVSQAKIVGTRRVEVISYQGPDGQQHTCHSLDEVPPDIRAKVREAIASGQGITREVFSYQGPDGQKKTYHSLEEMPPDLRAIYQNSLECSDSSPLLDLLERARKA